MSPTTDEFARPSVWSIAAPSITLFLMATLAGVVIIKIVSSLGTPAVAAVTAGQRINFVMVALLMGMGSATTAMVSRAWGSGDKRRATEATRLSLKVGLGVCILVSISAISLAQPLAHFFQLDDESYPLAVDYIRLLCLFGPAQGIVMILSTAFRAIGDAKTPMFVGILANGISIAGAYVFAYGELGMPAMGVNGAAIGWGLSFAFAALAYLGLWLSGRLPLPFSIPEPKPARIDELPDLAGCAETVQRISLNRFLTICLPATMEQVVMQGAMLLFVGFVAAYGTPAFAAYGVGMNLFAVTMVIGLGFSIAASALVGQCLGAGDHQAALDSVYQALRLALTTMVISGILAGTFAEELAHLMVDDPEVAALTAQFVIVVALMQPMLAVDFVFGGAMRGAGYTGYPLIAGLITILGVRLPLAALVTEFHLPVQWIFGVFVVDLLVKAIMISLRFRKRTWLHHNI
ncbi:MATE family efflux transporter [Pseudomaricurvus alkylphenolicus]|jgi:putative MATE family efflux protein|uniref:MATE family efflux transporter n=1 Tax=Pseudomaricurvus alkylphenolicus TaxID=1306991 RepID=UPI001421464E|nr:MATE family efflux transporter [Pseudomaricurvus alkylphenolicus]NIB40896.1 MATE family efflux transporter [Pseudomaricurvus alkylphenolicus]